MLVGRICVAVGSDTHCFEQFTLDQAILNEEKDLIDHSLELYRDAASSFLKVYRSKGLPFPLKVGRRSINQVLLLQRIIEGRRAMP
jgi:hypothetical protein